MKSFTRLCAAAGFFVTAALAAKPIATVTSAEALKLNGHSVNTPGVTSFPIVIGDTVSTAKGPAVLVFPEGSTVKLETNSSVRIAGAEDKPQVVLLNGSLDYKLIAGTNLSVTNLDNGKTDTTTPTPASTGAAPNTRKPLGGLLANPKFLIPAAGVGAAGVATGLLTLPPVSRHL